MMDFGWSWGWPILGMVMMSAFWLLIIGGGVWLAVTLSRNAGQRGDGTSATSARRILEERLARGEIDVEEFKTRAAALEEKRP